MTFWHARSEWMMTVSMDAASRSASMIALFVAFHFLEHRDEHPVTGQHAHGDDHNRAEKLSPVGAVIYLFASFLGQLLLVPRTVGVTRILRKTLWNIFQDRSNAQVPEDYCH